MFSIRATALITRGGVFVLLAASPLGTAVGRAQGDNATDQQRLQGTWVCVVSVRDGKPVQDFVGVKVQFAGNRLTWIFPKKDGTTNTQKGTFTIDPAQNPKHFDWADERSPDKTHRRLYLMEGDLIVMSANIFKTPTVDAPGQRPTSFNDGQFLFVVKRVPDAR